MPQPWVTRAILRTIASLPKYPNLDVLDLSCGEGEILANLYRAGCRCRGTHYRSDDYTIKHEQEALREICVEKGVDLSKPLPFDDASHDVVIMSEVIEHLPTHHSVIAEVARIVKPGGYFVFSTPNIHRVQSRWQYFLTGTHKLIRRRIGWDLTRDDIYAFHISPLDLPTTHTLLHQVGLHIREMRFTRVKSTHSIWLLFYPIFWLLGRVHFRSRRKEPQAYCEGERDLRRWMLHPSTFISDQLLVVAQRDADVRGSAATDVESAPGRAAA